MHNEFDLNQKTIFKKNLKHEDHSANLVEY